MDTRIYVMTHKQYTQPEDTMYISLHVGRAGKEDLGYQGDHSGDNISAKNANYCELTGMYWIWKNVACDNVGICHYRRYFMKEDCLLTKEFVEKTLADYPIIVPNSRCSQYANEWEHYTAMHHLEDLIVCGQVLQEKYPDYYPAFEWSLQCNMLSHANMVITRKDIFDTYCEWLFDILFEVEKRVDFSDYDDYQARIMGFLSERLFRAWLMHQTYPICEIDVKQVELQDLNNGIKSVQLKSQYVQLVLKELVRLYQKGQRSLLEPPPLPQRDFDGKIPVWMCWFQGMEQAPEHVQVCVDSVCANLPENRCVLQIITLENMMEYVTLSDTVIRKFQEGKLSYAFLSDLLRAELLYRYGGMWLDTTYYVANPVPDSLFKDDRYFTLKLARPKWTADIVQGRWSGNCIKGPRGFALFQFMMNGLQLYIEQFDEIIDYYLIDYVIAAAYENLPEVRAVMEACPPTNPRIFELEERINHPFNREQYLQLCSDTTFFKWNGRTQFLKKNVLGKETFYGNIYHRMCSRHTREKA